MRTLDGPAFDRLIDEELPFAKDMGISVVAFGPEAVCLRAAYDPSMLRPGGTISGPVMMALADAAVYGAVLARIGDERLSVTTQLSINFLRKPPPGDLLARASLLKLGRRLAVAEVLIWSEDLGEDEAVAHVTATYSIPPMPDAG